MKNVINDVKNSYNEYLVKIPYYCQVIADSLRTTQEKESLKLILQFSEGVDWLIEAGVLLDKNGVTSTLEIKKIHEFLSEINYGLEMQDYILVADMFEYEIKPFFESSSLYENK